MFVHRTVLLSDVVKCFRRLLGGGESTSWQLSHPTIMSSLTVKRHLSFRPPARLNGGDSLSFLSFSSSSQKKDKKGERLDNEPAPVVPPERLEERTVGDWVMVRSWPLTVSSRALALGSMIPRF